MFNALFIAIVFLFFSGVSPERIDAAHECCKAPTLYIAHTNAPLELAIAEPEVTCTESLCCLFLPAHGSLCTNPLLCNCDCPTGSVLLFVAPLKSELPRQKEYTEIVCDELFLQNLATSHSQKLTQCGPPFHINSSTIYHLNCVYRI